MKNVLKAEFHKIFHSGFFSYCFFFIFSEAFIQVFSASTSNNRKSIYNIVINTSEVMVLTIMLSGIYLIYNWNKERKNGYIKNIAGVVNGRHILTIAKFITGSVAVIINSFFTLVSVFICNLIRCLFNGGKVTFERAFSTQNLMRYAEFLIWIVAGIAIMAMLLMLHEIFRSAAWGYIMAIQILTGLLEALLAQGVALLFKYDGLAKYLIISGTKMMQAEPITEYVDSKAISEMYPNSMPGVFIRLCIYILVFTVISIVVSKKKDV